MTMRLEARIFAADRVRLWAFALLAANLGLLAARCAAQGGLWFLAPDGTRLPYDFLAFRAAGEMALRGEAALAYDWPRFLETVRGLMGTAEPHILAWLNPPNFLLIHAPLALLPYAVGWFGWLLPTALLYALAFRMAWRHSLAPVLAFAAPSAILCALQAQSSFLSAGLLGAGLAMLPRSPVAAGLLFGCLSFKPSLGLVLPVALLAGRHWRAIGAAAAAVIGFALLSAVAFGTEAWHAYLQSAGFYADFSLHDREDGTLRPRWPHAQSFYNFGLTMSGSAGVATALHLAVALPTAGLAALLWWRGASLPLKAAAALAATFLATPYVHAYDALMLTIATAFLAEYGLRHGFLPGDRIALCLAFVLPGGVIFVPFSLFAPMAALLMLAVAFRQAGAVRPQSA